MKYPQVSFSIDLNSPEGNAFAILGKAKKEMEMAGIGQHRIEQFCKEATSGDYHNLINTCHKWFDFKVNW